MTDGVLKKIYDDSKYRSARDKEFEEASKRVGAEKQLEDFNVMTLISAVGDGIEDKKIIKDSIEGRFETPMMNDIYLLPPASQYAHGYDIETGQKIVVESNFSSFTLEGVLASTLANVSEDDVKDNNRFLCPIVVGEGGGHWIAVDFILDRDVLMQMRNDAIIGECCQLVKGIIELKRDKYYKNIEEIINERINVFSDFIAKIDPEDPKRKLLESLLHNLVVDNNIDEVENKIEQEVKELYTKFSNIVNNEVKSKWKVSSRSSTGWDCGILAMDYISQEVNKSLNKELSVSIKQKHSNDKKIAVQSGGVIAESNIEIQKDDTVKNEKGQVEVPTLKNNIPLLKIHNPPILRNYHIGKIMNNLVDDYLDNNDIDDLVAGIHNLIGRVQSQENEYEIYKVGRLLKIMEKVKELVASKIISEDTAKDIYKSTGLYDYKDIGKLSPLEYKKKYYSSELKDFHSKKIGSRSERRSRRNSSLSYRVKRSAITGSQSARSISKTMKPVLKQKNQQTFSKEQVKPLSNDNGPQTDVGGIVGDSPKIRVIKKEISSKIDELKSLNNAYLYSIVNDPNRTKQEVEKEQGELYGKLKKRKAEFLAYIENLAKENPNLPIYPVVISEVENKLDERSYKNPLLGQLPRKLGRDFNKFKKQQMQQNNNPSILTMDVMKRIDSVEKLEKRVNSVEKQISSATKLTNNLPKITRPVVKQTNQQTFSKEQVKPLSNDNGPQTDVGGIVGDSPKIRALNAELSRKKQELSSATGLFEDNRALVKG